MMGRKVDHFVAIRNRPVKSLDDDFSVWENLLGDVEQDCGRVFHQVHSWDDGA